jgi:hypothetical protein
MEQRRDQMEQYGGAAGGLRLATALEGEDGAVASKRRGAGGGAAIGP